jgi:sodium-dependent phosphate transporter
MDFVGAIARELPAKALKPVPLNGLALPGYEWFIVIGAFAAFAFGFATGSNDVANAFATSVGSRTLTMRQAVLIAIIFEFTGAMVLSRVSTSVIATGVADVNSFVNNPSVFAYGMICALTSGALFQLWASWAGYNVSATQSIIGGIIGFALIWDGADGVKWAEKDSTNKTFPPVKGVVPIILSWFIAPLLTGLASAITFSSLRILVLRRARSTQFSYYVLPFAVFLTTWVNMYFVFAKGAAKTLAKDKWSNDKSKWVAAVIALCLFVLTAVVVVPLIKFKTARDLKSGRSLASERFNENASGVVEKKSADPVVKAVNGEGSTQTYAASATVGDVDITKPTAHVNPNNMSEEQRTATGFKGVMSRALFQLKKGTEYDVHAVVEEDPIVGKIHANAEKFDPKTEVVFSYLQVFSAIAVIFAHGAGEVGYMSGPFSQVYSIVRTGKLSTKSFVPETWIIALCAGSLVVGLATYGYNVMQAMGTMMAKLSPSRGFAAELATAMVIMVASQYGLPTSSSQCITGGILGVGLCEGTAGVNWMYVLKQMCAWAATLIFVGGFSALLFANAIYTPSIYKY